MDYMDLIKQSLKRAWQYKFLWLFGFFVAAADGSSSIGWQEDSGDVNWAWLDEMGLQIEPAFIALLILLGLSLLILFWVLAVLSEGALIFGVYHRELNRPADFAQALNAGTSKFLRLFGIILLATIAVITAFLLLTLLVLPAYFMAVPLGIVLTVIAVPVLIGLILTVVAVEGWAIRYGVIYDQPWLEAIGYGWRLFRANIGRSVAVTFSSFFTQFVLGLALVIGMVLLAIPFIIIGVIDLWMALIPGVVVGLVVILGYTGFIGTFASSIWTLAFMRLTGQAPAGA